MRNLQNSKLKKYSDSIWLSLLTQNHFQHKELFLRKRINQNLQINSE